jgi:LPXTG-motif cell wall-anchored protein
VEWVKLKKINFIIVIAISFTLILNYFPIIQSSAKSTSVLDIDTSPREYFIMVDRLKPGDKIFNSIEVRNIGNLNFAYNLKTEYISGSKEFFNELLLNIKDEKGNVIYSGKLNRTQEIIKNRNLNMLNKEKLFFEIDVPNELDNFYQGLTSNVKLVFFAEDNTSPQIEGNKLPNTGSHMFNYVAIGGFIVGLGILLNRSRKKLLNKSKY